MKIINSSTAFVLAALLYFGTSYSYADKTVMDIEHLEVRDELRYVAGETQPFTGRAVSYFPDGMQKLQVSFMNGLKHGREVAWYDDGQLRYVVRYRHGEPQSVGSAWYARSNQTKAPVSVFSFCEDDSFKKGFCDPGLQESSYMEITR